MRSRWRLSEHAGDLLDKSYHSIAFIHPSQRLFCGNLSNVVIVCQRALLYHDMKAFGDHEHHITWKSNVVIVRQRNPGVSCQK
jgi:hypothetical protein